MKLAKDHASFFACQKLASLFQGTGDQTVKELILDKLFCDGKGKHAVPALILLEQVGSSDLANLWAKVSETTKTTGPLVKFYQHWHTQGVKRIDIVDWVNKTLKPETPISIDSVLNRSKFQSEFYDGHFLGRSIHRGFVDSPHKFTLLALAHSGSGELAIVATA